MTVRAFQRALQVVAELGEAELLETKVTIAEVDRGERDPTKHDLPGLIALKNDLEGLLYRVRELLLNQYDLED